MSADRPKSDLFTVPQAAEYLNLSSATVRRLIRDGALTGTFLTPRALRVTRESMDALVDRHATTVFRGGEAA